MPASPTIERVIETRDASATRRLGATLARAAARGDVVSLVGDLGAGKTQLAKGFAKGLGVEETVVSPSFVLMAEYRGRLPLFHVDLFRLTGSEDALAGGLVDERQTEGVTIVEWGERLSDALPASRLDVFIDGSGEEPRRIVLRATAPEYARYLEVLDATPQAAEASRA